VLVLLLLRVVAGARPAEGAAFLAVVRHGRPGQGVGTLHDGGFLSRKAGGLKGEGGGGEGGDDGSVGCLFYLRLVPGGGGGLGGWRRSGSGEEERGGAKIGANKRVCDERNGDGGSSASFTRARDEAGRRRRPPAQLATKPPTWRRWAHLSFPRPARTQLLQISKPTWRQSPHIVSTPSPVFFTQTASPSLRRASRRRGVFFVFETTLPPRPDRASLQRHAQAHTHTGTHIRIVTL
jgi:hypothetical protein